MNTMSTINKDGKADNVQDTQYNTMDAQAMNMQENSTSDTRSDEVFRTEEKQQNTFPGKLRNI